MKKAKKEEAVIQQVFLQKLKEVLPTNISLADEISEVLEVSIDSAYRRLRGETDLAIDEVYKLAKKHNISLDGIFSNLNDTVTFAYTKLTDSCENFEKYLGRIYHHLKLLNSFNDKRLLYVAEELPIFYSFFGKKLIEFKLFYWQRSVLNVAEYQGKKFEFGFVPERLIKLAGDCMEEYKTIPSLEIWTDETIFTAIRQIEFYWNSGVFKNKEDTLDILDDVKSMVDYLEQCAENARKNISDKEETFQLYASDVVLGTNCIYVQSGDSRFAYISFNSFNSLTTNNAEFCDETDHWIKNLVKKSTLISGVAEKQRYQFFNKIRTNIENCVKRIENNAI
jgi:hypothetical protein